MVLGEERPDLLTVPAAEAFISHAGGVTSPLTLKLFQVGVALLDLFHLFVGLLAQQLYLLFLLAEVLLLPGFCLGLSEA